jgi:hypothetical protein
MEERNTAVRALHDLGLATWFGGSLMGSVGLNGASRDVADPTDRAKLAADGWARWAPFAAGAIGTHLIGGLGLVLGNRGRLSRQPGAAVNTAVKTVLTGAAIATTAYSGLLGARVARGGQVASEGGTEPSPETPDAVAGAQRQLRILQWTTPALTGVLIVLGAQQGEQQRPSQLRRALFGGKRRTVSR